MIQAIFFDFNGVIIDDERIHLKAYREILKAEDVELTDEDYFNCLGMDDVAFTRAAFARAGRTVDDEKARDVIDREHAMHRSLIEEEVPWAPGVITFIKEAARYYPLGIVSMAPPHEIDYTLKRGDIVGCFSILVTSSDVSRHKPAPDCYHRGLELLNAKRQVNRKLPLLPDECLVIEDAPQGIEGARAAGMRTLGITTTVPGDLLRAAGADIVTASFADCNTYAVRRLFE